MNDFLLLNPGYPTASFRWRKNGTDQSQINGTFIIPSTTLLDNGVYSCTPYNSVGEGVPDTVTINVNGKWMLSAIITMVINPWKVFRNQSFLH